MTSEKKVLVKRMLLYSAFAFAPLLIAIPILNHYRGGLLFEGALAASPVTSLVSSLVMLCPAIASILTRLLTKEGLQASYLRANFKGNGKYYALACAIPVVCGLAGALLARQVYGASADNTTSIMGGTAYVIGQISTSILFAFYGLGEELGWRGYLMPKLERFMGMPASVLAGGIIWGIWYAPLTCSGYHFGAAYEGFPYLGIALMCLWCVSMNSILTFLTKKTNSVYPAAILHSLNNHMFYSMQLLLVSPNIERMGAFCLSLLPILLLAVVTFVLMLRSKKQEIISTGTAT